MWLLELHLQIDMEAPEFKDFAKSMVDYIADYLENVRDRWVSEPVTIHLTLHAHIP